MRLDSRNAWEYLANDNSVKIGYVEGLRKNNE